MLDRRTRNKICQDTIAQSATIAASVTGGSLDSRFIPSQLPTLTKSDPNYPGLERKPIEVHNSDTFALARKLTSGINGKVGVLNLASDSQPGGGWPITLSVTQEEALCYSSTLYSTLNPEWYPWPNTGPGSCAAVFSPNVVVFRDTLDNDLADLPLQQRHVLSVITIAAPRWPEVTKDAQEFAKESDLEDLREKILLTLRLAGANGITSLVLGAMGCGAYGCPPMAVAKEMKRALELEEFSGWFEHIVFAVYAAGPTGKKNLDTFQQIFHPTT